MGRRTFTRTFRRETGMTFAGWRHNVRLMEAMSRPALGQPVTRVALDVGYKSPERIRTAMFRRAFGVSPTDYPGDLRRKTGTRSEHRHCAKSAIHVRSSSASVASSPLMISGARTSRPPPPSLNLGLISTKLASNAMIRCARRA